MNEENIQQISKSTSAISDWSIRLLSGVGIPDDWVNVINLIFLTAVLVILPSPEYLAGGPEPCFPLLENNFLETPVGKTIPAFSGHDHPV